MKPQQILSSRDISVPLVRSMRTKKIVYRIIFFFGILLFIIKISEVLSPELAFWLSSGASEKRPVTMSTEPEINLLGSCPNHGMVTVEDRGRLGNKIWEYASVWAVAKILRLEPYVPDSMHKTLSKVFRHLSIPSIETIKHCTTELERLHTPVLHGGLSRNINSKYILLNRYTLLFHEVMNFSKQLKTEFVYRQKFIDAANEKFRYVKSVFTDLRKTEADLTFVGVHVRRTDYLPRIRKLKLYVALKEFYMQAMNWFRSKFPNVVFLVTSDDMGWCEENLKSGDVFFASAEGPESPVYDLSLLSLCNHSIFDYGTFGLWAAVMTGGSTITFDSGSGYYILKWAVQFLPDWHLISNIKYTSDNH